MSCPRWIYHQGSIGNFPFERAAKYSSLVYVPPPILFVLNRQLYAAPWLNPDPLDREKTMIPEEMDDLLLTIPPGVISRHRVDFPEFKKLPDPIGSVMTEQGRYRDEQLYALARYIYSLKPPANPNKFSAAAMRGKKIFEREGCASCHTPPLDTNNKLTPAGEFVVPPTIGQSGMYFPCPWERIQGSH